MLSKLQNCLAIYDKYVMDVNSLCMWTNHISLFENSDFKISLMHRLLLIIWDMKARFYFLTSYYMIIATYSSRIPFCIKYMPYNTSHWTAIAIKMFDW